MEYWIGLLCAAFAAIAFGVQYAPVKKYEIYDGITFQWFMCAGILMVGFLSSIIFGDFGMKDNECLLIIFGGGLWALSNYLVLPLVKLLGIGLGVLGKNSPKIPMIHRGGPVGPSTVSVLETDGGVRFVMVNPNPSHGPMDDHFRSKLMVTWGSILGSL